MKTRELARCAAELLDRTLLETGEPDCGRFLIADAVVVRKGNHFAIEAGADEDVELDSIALRLEGRCDCGAPLSSRGERLLCRICGREYRWH